MAVETPTADVGAEGGLGVGSGIASLFILPFVAVATIVAKIWHDITSDGTLAAAARQGADELGAALKAFPDSIQVQETGQLWSPTQGEIAADRSQGRHGGSYSSYSSSSMPPHPWPSEVANQNRGQPEHDHEHDQDLGHSL